MNRTPRLVVTLCVVVAAAACGGGGSSPAAPAPTGSTPTSPGPASGTTATVTVSGSTRQISATGCGGDSPDFTAADGTIGVTLTATSDPNMALSLTYLQ